MVESKLMFRNRIKRLQHVLQKKELDAFLVEDRINLYYLTGLDISAGRMVVTQQEATLIVDLRYFERCTSASPIPLVLEEDKILENLLKEVASLGFNREALSYGQYERLKDTLEKGKFSITLVPTEDLLVKLRAIKDRFEISRLREAAALGSEGYDFVLSCLKEGVTEREVANRLEIFWKERGSFGAAFDPMIAFGTHGSMPHYKSGDVPLKQGDAVLIDIGVNLERYNSDMTRVFFFGKVPSKIEEIYRVVKEAEQAALALCKPGTTVAELDRAARRVIEEAGYGEAFTHSLGHGIGLELHEEPLLRKVSPFSERVLEEGMVFTLEPGIYLPAIGGVRYEDTICVTKEGCENLTCRH